MTEQPQTTADVDLDGEIFPDFPPGWRSVSGIIEAFLFTGAAEVQARQRIDPYNPWGSHASAQLPTKFQVDGLGSLIGQSHDAGEQIGRPVLLGLVWRFIDEVYAATSHLGDQDKLVGWQLAQREIGRPLLGRYGAMLFDAAMQLKWFSNVEPRGLSDIEIFFLQGKTAIQEEGHRQTALIPNVNWYVDSIWSTAFRLIERRSPEFYLNLCRHKADVVEYIINRKADDQNEVRFQSRYRWTGWPQG